MKSTKNHSLKFITATIIAVAALGLVSLQAIAAPSCAAPPAGQVAWWRAEGTATDAVGNNQ